MKLLGTVQQGTTALLLNSAEALQIMIWLAVSTLTGPAGSREESSGVQGPGAGVPMAGGGGYRVPYGYVTDMKPKYVTIYI